MGSTTASVKEGHCIRKKALKNLHSCCYLSQPRSSGRHVLRDRVWLIGHHELSNQQATVSDGSQQKSTVVATAAWPKATRQSTVRGSSPPDEDNR